MLSNFLDSVGCEPKEVKLKKKIIILSDGSQRIVYDNEGHETTNCRYCGNYFDECDCDRTEHIYDEESSCCILCKETFKPNGTGPANNRFLHFIINIFPFNRWVKKISDLHDIGYWCGFLLNHKVHQDNEMLRRTVEKIKKTWWLFPNRFWIRRANINYEAVEHGGDSSFNWSGCVLPENVSGKKDLNVKN